MFAYFPGLQTVFTACDEFIKFAAGGGCRFCLKEVQATEAHLMKRHYLSAVHFIQDLTGKFFFCIQIKASDQSSIPQFVWCEAGVGRFSSLPKAETKKKHTGGVGLL